MKGRPFLVLLTVAVGLVGSAYGDLYPANGGLTVYDDQSQLYWWANLASLRGMNYSEQMDAIADLPGSWHMATLPEIETLAQNSHEQIGAFFTTDIELHVIDSRIIVWGGRYDHIVAPGIHAYAVTRYNATQDTWASFFYGSRAEDSARGYSAWVVGTPVAVPLPSAALLGVIGLGAASFRLKRKCH